MGDLFFAKILTQTASFLWANVSLYWGYGLGSRARWISVPIASVPILVRCPCAVENLHNCIWQTVRI